MSTRSRAPWMVALSLTLLSPAALHAQTLPSNPTTMLAPLAGPQYQAAPGLGNIGFSGTDLGFTYKHNGQMRIIFGDTASGVVSSGDSAGELIPISTWTNPPRDDAQGTICMQASGCPTGAALFPRGNAVDSYVASHQNAFWEFSWQDDAPPVWWRLGLDGLIASQHPYNGGITIKAMGGFRTPIAAFSNARSGSNAAAYAIFGRGVALQCSPGVTPTCPTGFACDRSLGTWNGVTSEDADPCSVGLTRPNIDPSKPDDVCRALASSGICVDNNNRMYEPFTPLWQLQGVVKRQEIGNADPAVDEIYYTQTWNTNKMLNLAVRTVNDFLPSRANGVGNDYNPPDATQTNNERLFLWGRPAFFGSAASGHPAPLYFAVANLQNYSASGPLLFAPSYFTGLNASGVPQFSTNPAQAKALDLNGTAEGLPNKEDEKFDVVNQMSVAFVPTLNKWVMLYGGDTFHWLLAGGVNVGDPEGAIHVRFASQPWGPWSRPKQLFKAGNPDAGPLAGSEFGPGGRLFHPNCTVANCVKPPGQNPGRRGHGFLYGANLIAEWTEPRSNGAVDIYWNVSTWNPYQVLLMRSRINP